jgi:hypothetical protein
MHSNGSPRLRIISTASTAVTIIKGKTRKMAHSYAGDERLILVEALDNYRLRAVSGIVTARTEHLQIGILQSVQWVRAVFSWISVAKGVSSSRKPTCVRT